LLSSTFAAWRNNLRDSAIEIMGSGTHRYRWYPSVVNYGRTTLDIRPWIFGGARLNEPYIGVFLSVVEAARQNSDWLHTARENFQNDPDMLVVDNGLSDAENRSHFAMWAIMNAPLLLGNDPRAIRKETLALVTNPAPWQLFAISPLRVPTTGT
jgi:alpha-galactosidase